MSEPDFLLFASDATILALIGSALLAVALVAVVGEQRRMRRKHLDAVGLMPWTRLFFVSFFLGVTLLALGVSGWFNG